MNLTAPSHWNFIELGDPIGRPMVWLHGWGQSHKSFEALAELYTGSANSRLYDLPGFGETPRLGDGAGTADYADALAEQISEPCTIIGHSFGCRIAVQLATRHPKLVERLVLISAAGIPRKRSLAWKVRSRAIKMLGRLAGLSDTIFRTKLRAKWSDKFGSADYRNAGALRPTFVSVVNEDLSDQATEIDVPVLLIYGADDTETPPEIGVAYDVQFPNSELHILDGYDHFDILARGKHQCQRLIDRFMGGASNV